LGLFSKHIDKNGTTNSLHSLVDNFMVHTDAISVKESLLRGAARVFSIDHWPDRIAKTKALGAETINFDEEAIGDPAKKIKDLTGGEQYVLMQLVMKQ
jgi:hypothetical protein